MSHHITLLHFEMKIFQIFLVKRTFRNFSIQYQSRAQKMLTLARMPFPGSDDEDYLSEGEDPPECPSAIASVGSCMDSIADELDNDDWHHYNTGNYFI